MASAADIGLLRCEADRLASVAIKEGAELAPIPKTGPLDEDTVQGVADVAAYALTMWELELLRTLGYSAFNSTFDAMARFVEEPTEAELDRYVTHFAALFSAAATRRGVPSRCGVHLTFPGLNPPDARILPQNLPDDLDVPQSPPLIKRTFRLPLGFKITLGAGVGVFMVLAGAAWAVRRRTLSSKTKTPRSLQPPV